MGLVKITKTLSTATLQEVPCSILEEGGSVFLVKEDPGERHLIERDAPFYKKLQIPYQNLPSEFDKIMIDITTQCNLRCSVCYRRLNSEPDINIAVLRKLSRVFRGKVISLCGGEPTMRSDLPEIIRMFSRQNTVFLITNGIRLADVAYAKELKKAGLRHISFSLNGFSEETLGKINGPGLLSDKLQALNNLKALKMNTVLAFVLVKGLNEGDLGRILSLCLENRDFIQELRIRAMVPMGSHLEKEKVCISEMLDIVVGALEISKADVLREFELKRLANLLFGHEIFGIKSCSFDFHLGLGESGFIPLGRRISADTSEGYPRFLRKAIVVGELVKLFGMSMVVRGVAKKVLKADFLPWIHPRNVFKIGLRAWPDIHTIDLEENKRCKTGYWFGGGVISFCRANILKDAREGGRL